MIRIITDSTSDISQADAKKKHIDVISLKVIMKDKIYNDGIDLTADSFYEKLPLCHPIPTTSQPSPQEFYEAFCQADQKDEEILVITLSSQLSGTYQSAVIAAHMGDFKSIAVIDSQNATQGLRLLVEKAIALRDQSMSLHEISEQLEAYKQRIRIFAYVDTLEYFYRGGRLSKSSAIIGSLLKFKPIVGLKEGKLELLGKGRGMKKAVDVMLELICESGEVDLSEPLCIGYTGKCDDLDRFADLLKQKLHFQSPLYGAVGPVIGTHTGPNAKVFAYVLKE